jgi:hypothetical protein
VPKKGFEVDNLETDERSVLELSRYERSVRVTRDIMVSSVVQFERGRELKE